MAYSKRSAHDTCGRGLQALGITVCCCGSVRLEGQLHYIYAHTVQLQMLQIKANFCSE